MSWLGLGATFVLLIALNAFFVLAECAIVRVRSSRVSELAARGVRGSGELVAVHAELDQHIGACQIGITLASIALGLVSQRVAELVSGGEAEVSRYVAAIAVAYVLVSGTHLLFGEMVPKVVAVRKADALALRCAAPLHLVRGLFLPCLWVLAKLSRFVARASQLPVACVEERHTDQEIRIILRRHQEQGQISIGQLNRLESILDAGPGRSLPREAARPQ